jgi:GNAT superfamily N-acetyltransferase
MKQQDLASVSSICMKAFMHGVAHSLSSEGIDTFKVIAAADSFLHRSKGDNAILVFENEGRVKGVVELKEGRHVAMLFVDPQSQKRGIGGELISEVMAYARTNTITVSASLNSVSTYLRYGFVCIGEPDETSGLKYQPMELELNKSNLQKAL